MNEYTCDWMTGKLGKISVLWLLQGYCTDNCCRSRGLPNLSTIFYFGSCVCKNDKVQSSKSLYQIEAACIQKAGSIATFYVRIPQVLPKVCFQTKPDTGSDINYIYIRESVSLSFLSIPPSNPVLGTVPTLRLSALKLWLVFCLVPSEPDHDAERDRESYFKAFVVLLV